MLYIPPRRQFVLIKLLRGISRHRLEGNHITPTLTRPSDSSPTVPRRRPCLAKRPARVRKCQQDASRQNHGAIEDHEGDLVLGQVAGEAAGKLGASIACSNEDEEGYKGEAYLWLLRKVSLVLVRYIYHPIYKCLDSSSKDAARGI